MGRPIHFEFEAEDPARAAAFYRTALGWRVEKWDGPGEYWLVDTGEDGPGIHGGMARRAGPKTGTVNTIGVASLDDTLKAVTAAGGKVTSPRHAVPGIGWLAYCEDTEGNAFGLMQEDASAR